MQQRVFRVFVSSTFSDFYAERNVLQKIVFPELERRCRAISGTFLGVDLRWGISPQRALSNQTMSTCFDEIRRCQEVSPKPNFLILLGDRYGWVPLPEVIHALDWTPLLAAVDPKAAELMGAWYECDFNAKPAAWILKPRAVEYEDQNSWETQVELPLGEAIRLAAAQLPEARQLPYLGSATHQEIFRGLFSTTDSNQVVAWCRKLSHAPTSFYSQTAEEQMVRLKKSVLDRLGERGVERVAEFGEIDKFQDPQSILTDSTLSPYLQDFASTVTELLWVQIEANSGQFLSPDPEELQDRFIRAKALGIVGRAQEMEDIQTFLSETGGGLKMVTGPGGQGKTSLLALACLHDIESQPEPQRVWIRRFAGAGGNIDSIDVLLASMFTDVLFDQFWEREIQPRLQAEYFYPAYHLEQFFWNIGLQVSLPRDDKKALPVELGHDASKSNDQKIREQIKAAVLKLRDEIIAQIIGDNIAEPRCVQLNHYLQIIRYLKGSDLVVVLDGIDQWFGAPDFLATLEQLGLGELSKLEGIWLLAAAREARGSALQGLGREPWESIADQAFLLNNRCLQPPTKALEWVKSGWKSANGNPLSLRVGLERAVRLRSFDPVPDVSFKHGGLLRDWLSDISSASQHGDLALRALGFLSMAEHGLPEPFLLKLLSADLKILEWFSAQIEKTGQRWDLANGLPPVLWSRLRKDLGGMLTVSGDDGHSVLRLIHPALRDELAVFAVTGLAEREEIAKVAEASLVSGLERLDEGAVSPRLFEYADPWALKELIAQWQYVASDRLDQFMELPAFAFAVAAVPGAFDVWAAGVAPPPPMGSLRALLKRHQTELRLQASPIDRIRLILQQSFPTQMTGSKDLIGLKIREWTDEVELLWISNLQGGNSPKPVSEVPAPITAMYATSSGKLAAVLKTVQNGTYLAVSNPQRLGGETVFMSVRETYLEDSHRPVSIEQFVEFSDLFVTRQSIGPIRIWRNGKELARLVCDIYDKAGSAGLKAEKLYKFTADQILVQYEGDLLAVWTLNDLGFVADAPTKERRASDDDVGFQILFSTEDPTFQEAIVAAFDGQHYLKRSTDAFKRSLIHVGERNFSLMLIYDHDTPPVLVTYFQGTLKFIISQHRSINNAQILGPNCLAFWAPGLNALILMTTDGERLFQISDNSATISPIGYSDSYETLYCNLNIGSEGYVSRLMSVNLHTATLRWHGPRCQLRQVIAVGNVKYLLLQLNGILALMRMNDAAEPQIVAMVNTSGFWPEACRSDAQTGLIFGRSGRRIAIIDPESGSCDVVTLESPIQDFEVIGELLACAHGDGMFRLYRLPDIRFLKANAAQHINSLTCIAKIGEKALITASSDQWLLWQADAPGRLRQSILWEQGSSGNGRKIRYAAPLNNGCVTWGDEIVFWRWSVAGDLLEKEHKIWNTAGGSMHCNDMVLELGNDDFLFEYNSDYLDIPGTIGRIRWAGLSETGEWRAGSTWKDDLFNAHVTDQPTKRRWRSILSPVFPDGWVLVGETSEPSYTQTETVAAYNVHSEETRVGMALGYGTADPWLIELVNRHRDWVAKLSEARWKEMLRWGGGVTANRGAIDMPHIYGANRLSVPSEEDAGTIVGFKQFQALATQRNFMFRDMLGYLQASQRNIGMRAHDAQNIPYISAREFRIDESLVREQGMVMVQDRGGRIHILQLMNGSRPCVGLG